MSVLAFPLDGVLGLDGPTGVITAACSPSKPMSSIAADSYPAHSLAFKDAANAAGKIPLVTMRTISETESRKNRTKAKNKKSSPRSRSSSSPSSQERLQSSSSSSSSDALAHHSSHSHQDSRGHSSSSSNSGGSSGSSSGSSGSSGSSSSSHHKKKSSSSSKKKSGSGFENTGRWTSEEHQMFLNGLDSYGKEWKKIAELIKTRTVVQIRTHAQKYFQKVAKAREQANEKIPATFRSTAMLTKPIKSGGSKSGASKKRKSCGGKKGNGQSGSSKKSRSRAKSVPSPRAMNSKRGGVAVADKMVSFKVHLGDNDDHLKQLNVADTLADPLSIRLDLFRNTQPLPFQFDQQAGAKFGGNSPTTAVVDLFAPETFESDPAAGGLGGLDFLDADIDGYDFEEMNDCTSDTGTETCNSGETTPSGSPLPLASRGRINTNNAFPKKHALAGVAAHRSKPLHSSPSSANGLTAPTTNKAAIKPIKLHDGSPSLVAMSGIDLPMALRTSLLEPLTRSASAHCLNSLPTPAGAGILRRAGGTRHSQFRAGDEEEEEDDESFMSGLLGELTA
jgi:SHAQKYF class myb-like DNA-binding protein